MIFPGKPVVCGKHMNHIYICTIHSFEREREREREREDNLSLKAIRRSV